MTPPKTLDVLDKHGGFTALTLAPTSIKIILDNGVEREAQFPQDYPNGVLDKPFVRWDKVLRERDTLWRPGILLKRTTIGMLAEFDENSFYQLNNTVTRAIYRVPGYRFRVVCWFDNATGERIA